MKILFSILFCLLYTLSYASNKDSIVVTKKGKYEIRTLYRSNFGGVIISKSKKVGKRKSVSFIITIDSLGNKVTHLRVKEIKSIDFNTLKRKRTKEISWTKNGIKAYKHRETIKYKKNYFTVLRVTLIKDGKHTFKVGYKQRPNKILQPHHQ